MIAIFSSKVMRLKASSILSSMSAVGSRYNGFSFSLPKATVLISNAKSKSFFIIYYWFLSDLTDTLPSLSTN